MKLEKKKGKSNQMTCILIFIILMICFALGYLFSAHQKQQTDYNELQSYIDSHNSRLNKLEHPELVNAHKKPKGGGE